MTTEKRARTFKVLSALLIYPTEDMQAAADEMRTIVRDEGLVHRRDLDALERLIDEIGNRDLYELQERYTLLFDRSRSLSLHLFEHVHGESRDRGQAMVDLGDHYAANGFAISANELPDFLPLFLEFLSAVPAEEARALLGETLPILKALEDRLAKRSSPYASVFRALRAVARGKIDPARLAALEAEPDPSPDDFVALDADWEEAEVRFGPGTAEDACGGDRLRTRLRAANRDVTQMPPQT